MPGEQMAIAVVGLGGLFPGAKDLEGFWELIRGAGEAAREAPPGRWMLPTSELYDAAGGRPDRVSSRRACFLDDLPRPAASLLGLEEARLEALDPLLRLSLVAAQRAVASVEGGLRDQTRVGVIIGNIALPTDASSRCAERELGPDLAASLGLEGATWPSDALDPLDGEPAGLPAGFLARAFGFGGHTHTLDAACASSLYALKLAIEELREGRADAMLTGGVSRPSSLYTQMGFSQLRALSERGRCAPFDARGDGLVVGEGAGFFVLKRLSDALEAGDRVYGVIRGIGLSNDVGGRLLAPDSEGQLRAMRSAYEQAGWRPSDVELIECHATGTPVGDAVEFASLKELWCDEPAERRCVLGSVKSNIGHLLTAAGAAGLTKVLLAFAEGELPPTANFERPAPALGLESSPFEVLGSPRAWPRRAGEPRRAAVSAFGFGGINAHVLIEEAFGSALERRAASEVVVTETGSVAIVGVEAMLGADPSLRALRSRLFAESGKVAPGSLAARGWWGQRDGAGRGAPTARLEVPFGRFRIPPRELEEMLPQQLAMLLVAKGALEDAGFDELGLRGGVFVGIGLDHNTSNFHLRWALARHAARWNEELDLALDQTELAAWIDAMRAEVGPALNANRTMGALGGIVASRVARELKAGGPSFTLSSGATSGNSALAAAARMLRRGELDRAVVGAVDFGADLRASRVREALGLLAPDGVARPFGPDARGAGVSDAALAFVLCRSEDAERLGARVYAQLRGFGEASGGARWSGQVDDRSAALSRAIDGALEEAGVSAASVGLLESHGGADRFEDAAESAALIRGFTGGATAPPRLSASKAQLGHAGAASGLFGLLRATLSLHHEMFPAQVACAGLTPEQAGDPRPRYWLRDRADGARRVGVDAMSLDGHCCHAVLEEPAARAAESPATPCPAEATLLLFGGADGAGLERAIAGLEQLRAGAVSWRLDELGADWWRQHGAEALAAPERLAVVCSDAGGLEEALAAARASLAGRAVGARPGRTWQLFTGRGRLAVGGAVAFVYPGSGNHRAGMGARLSARWPEPFAVQDRENERLASQFCSELLWSGADRAALAARPRELILSQVSFGAVVTDLLRRFGLEASAAVGYSLGESAALFGLRAWRERDEMLRRVRASSLFVDDMAGACRALRKTWGLDADAPLDWAVSIVDRPAAEVDAALQGRARLYRLIINGPRECVVGGERSALDALIEELGCHSWPLEGITTVHCEAVEPVAEPYRALHSLSTEAPKGVRFYSGATGAGYALDRDSAADAILAQARHGVDFPALVRSAYEDGARCFVEIGPGQSCARMIADILRGQPHLVMAATGARNEDEVTALLACLGRVFCEGARIDLTTMFAGEGRPSATPGRTLAVPCDRREAPGLPKPAVDARGPGASQTPRPAAPAPAVAAADRTPSTALLEQRLASAASESSQSAERRLQELLAATLETEAARAAAQHAYVERSDALFAQIQAQLHRQLELVGAGARLSPGSNRSVASAATARVTRPLESSLSAVEVTEPVVAAMAPAPEVVFDRAACMELAIGSLEEVLGPRFAEIDALPTRVRLPDEPLMLVDRITALEGEPGSLGGGRVVTEHDVLEQGWYLDEGRIPTCIAVEAGQADLFLSGYLGIDAVTRGAAVYRLLDAVVSFHGPLPKAGQVIRYDIRILRFFRQGDTYLFRFEFDSSVDGRPLLTMREGCAGFFSAEELAAGRGIVHSRLELRPRTGRALEGFVPPTDMAPCALSEAQVEALRRGDLVGAFGAPFEGLPLREPVTIPGRGADDRMRLLDRVTRIEPSGGRYGVGFIAAELDIDPQDWFLTCHFVDDRVMPGTLMYECCLHTLRVFLLRMGWVGERGAVWGEPVPGVASQLRCRGQVTEETRRVRYEISVKELRYGPDAMCIADALMFADDRAVVEINDMSLRLTGLREQDLRSLWAARRGAAEASPGLLFDDARILAFATGRPSDAFGAPYSCFDAERVIARLPGPPYKFLDGITRIEGAEAFVLKAGAVVEARYEVPEEAWYFEASRGAGMPFAVLLEAALQPCGWLAGYLGSALESEQDLRFRNLGGRATQHRLLAPGAGVLSTEVRLTQVSRSGGMIIQNFDFCARLDGELVYEGDTYFGFFTKAALADQVGIREAELYRPTEPERARGRRFALPDEAPLPAGVLRMIDDVELFVVDGGPAGLGYVRGAKDVNPVDWFFAAHFYQDPVCPGSLGLEAFLQLLEVVAVERWGRPEGARFAAMLPGHEHSWVYRGQVIPTDRRVTVELVVTRFDDARRAVFAEGYLSVDGRVIYQMKDFAIALEGGPL